MHAGIEKRILSFLKNHSWETTLSSSNNVVTEARAYSDQLKIDLELHHLFSRFLPTVVDAQYISEESENIATTPDQYWLVDPLDGTSEFKKGIPEYAVSIALIKNGEPVIGVIFNPATGEYFCSDGLFFSKRKDLSLPKDGPSFLISRTEYKNHLHLEEAAISGSYTPIGGTAYKIGLIAAHKLSYGYVTYQPKSLWDIGAGCAILKRVYGIKATTLEGDEISFLDHKLRIPSMIVRPKRIT